jgi:hypothetical protein
MTHQQRLKLTLLFNGQIGLNKNIDEKKLMAAIFHPLC